MISTRAATALAVLGAVIVSLAGCGKPASQDDAQATAESLAPSEQPAQSAAALAAALTSTQACDLLQPGEVEAILGSTPNATPREQPAGAGARSAQCVWDAGSGNGDLTLTVVEGTDDVTAAILQATPIEGDAIDGIGEQAGVVVQGNYSVEVTSRVGPRVMTLSASALGVSDRKDAMVAAARAAAGRIP